MIKSLTKEDLIPLIPERKPASHKGENGRILIIGGSADFSGAPVLAGMAALYSGADLIRLFVPEENLIPSRSYQPEFIVKSYKGNTFNSKLIPQIQDWIDDSDCIVIGMGSENDKGFIQAVRDLIKDTSKKFILDSNAVFALEPGKDNSHILATPHATEFEALSGKEPVEGEIVADVAKEYRVNFVMTSNIDIIASPEGDFVLNEFGNAGMTVGGSGDVLAGLCGSLVGQSFQLYQAAQFGAYVLSMCGDNLSEEKGYAFSSTDLAYELPYVLEEFFK